MKTFTCKEGQGVCEKAFSGETAQEVGMAIGDHIKNSADEAHAELRGKMATMPKEAHDGWWKWFNAEWDKKAEG